MSHEASLLVLVQDSCASDVAEQLAGSISTISMVANDLAIDMVQEITKII
jgi:hypothetical protein